MIWAILASLLFAGLLWKLFSWATVADPVEEVVLPEPETLPSSAEILAARRTIVVPMSPSLPAVTEKPAKKKKKKPSRSDDYIAPTPSSSYDSGSSSYDSGSSSSYDSGGSFGGDGDFGGGGGGSDW